MSTWARRIGLNRTAFIVSLRAAVATVLAYLCAKGLRLPEFYWAPISTIVILLSTVNPMTQAWQRFAGTALGVSLGAVIATFFRANWIVYGLGILVCGLFSFLLRIAGAYRVAAIALTIVLLITHDRPPWTVAAHRFIEVSLGITIALLITIVWRVQVEA